MGYSNRPAPGIGVPDVERDIPRRQGPRDSMPIPCIETGLGYRCLFPLSLPFFIYYSLQGHRTSHAHGHYLPTGWDIELLGYMVSVARQMND